MVDIQKKKKKKP